MEENSISVLESLKKGTKIQEYSEAQRIVVVEPSAEQCNTPAPTVNNQIDTKNLINGSGDVVQFTIANGSSENVTVIIGLGLLNVTGTPALFNILDAAVDEPLVTDQGGAGAFKTSFFSQTVNGHGYIAKSIKIFSASAEQVSEQPIVVEINPNFDLKRKTGHLVKQNRDLNYVILDSCHVPLTWFQGVLYIVQAGETVSIEIDVLAVATIENFSTGLDR